MQRREVSAHEDKANKAKIAQSFRDSDSESEKVITSTYKKTVTFEDGDPRPKSSKLSPTQRTSHDPLENPVEVYKVSKHHSNVPIILMKKALYQNQDKQRADESDDYYEWLMKYDLKVVEEEKEYTFTSIRPNSFVSRGQMNVPPDKERAHHPMTCEPEVPQSLHTTKLSAKELERSVARMNLSSANIRNRRPKQERFVTLHDRYKISDVDVEAMIRRLTKSKKYNVVHDHNFQETKCIVVIY